MAERARARGMRIVGPNSQGLANFGTGAIASFSTMFIEVEPADGPVGIISQSGAMSVIPYGLLRRAASACVTRTRPATMRRDRLRAGDRRGGGSSRSSFCSSISRASLIRTTWPKRPGSPMSATCRSSCSNRGVPPRARRLRARTPARSLTRIASSTPSSSNTASGAPRTRPISSRPPNSISKAGSPAAGGLWRSAIPARLRSRSRCCVDGRHVARSSFRTDPGPSSERYCRASHVGNPVDITAALLTNSRLFGEILPVIANDPSADAFLVGVPWRDKDTTSRLRKGYGGLRRIDRQAPSRRGASAACRRPVQGSRLARFRWRRRSRPFAAPVHCARGARRPSEGTASGSAGGAEPAGADAGPYVE